MRGWVLAAAVLTAAPAAAPAQTVEWTRQFGTAGHDRAFAIAADASGVYVAGATEGALPGQRSAGGVDAFLRRYDVNGTEIWTRQFGTPVIDEILCIAVDATGIYVAGGTYGILSDVNAPPRPHAFIRKYDRSGTEVWTREFGSGRNEQVLALASGARGVFAAGDTTVTEPPYDDGFAAHFDANGTAGWNRSIATGVTDRASAIAIDASGVYVAGATEGVLPNQTRAGDADAFLRKYDFAGNELWTRQFGTAAADEILAIAIDESGVYVSGITHGSMPASSSAGETDAFVRKFDLDGRDVWTRQFGTDSYDDVLAIAVGDGVYVAGNTLGTLPDQTRAGMLDPFVRKYDHTGAHQWTLQFGTAADDEILGIAVGPGAIYGAGVTGAGLPGHASSGSYDAFVVKLRDRPPAGN